MCTVSFIPVKDTIFITSNRDEKNSRGKAALPARYDCNGCKMIFPKDAQAGGTWIAMKENGDAAVLLNGAFIRHVPDPPYRKSRGIIFLDILSDERPSLSFYERDLWGIEPFTIIVFEKKCLYEFRWDGSEKYYKQLSASRPYIWSSATLYDGLVVKRREHWFAKFLNRHPSPAQNDIVNFHRFSGDGDAANDLLMERDGIYSTVSITSISLTTGTGKLRYYDLKEGMTSEEKIDFLPIN